MVTIGHVHGGFESTVVSSLKQLVPQRLLLVLCMARLQLSTKMDTVVFGVLAAEFALHMKALLHTGVAVSEVFDVCEMLCAEGLVRVDKRHTDRRRSKVALTVEVDDVRAAVHRHPLFHAFQL